MANPLERLRPPRSESYTDKPHLTVQIRDRLGALDLDVSFQLSKAWTVLFGPSGSGKTTILKAIAGIHRPEAAAIAAHSRMDSTVPAAGLTDTANHIDLPPHQRAIPLAPQSPWLFPHMTVLENINYRTRGVIGPAEQDYWEILNEKLPAMFSIERLLGKKPRELSGGEASRVSLVRTLMARHKRLILLDEPFSGLDVPLRASIVENLLAWQEILSIPILSVTHDVAEAFQLGAEVIKIADGRVVAQGPVEVVLAEERKRLLSQLGCGDGQDASSEPFLSG